MSVQITRAAASDVPEVVETICRAFDADPIVQWWVPDAGRRAEIMPAFFGALCEAYLPWGEIYRCVDGGAAAVWAPPGGGLGEGGSAALDAAIAEAVGEYGESMRDMGVARAAGHPRKPHFYLHLLATRPPAQGHGYGGALLRAVLDRCDAEGFPSYLEATSTESKRLYERHGFVLLEAVTVRDSPPLWLMWREPASPPETMGS